MIVIKGIDDAILQKIDEVRARYDACTARELSRLVNVHHSYVSQRLHYLKLQGLVTFNHVPGSINRVKPQEGTLETVIEPETELTPAQERMRRAREAKAAKAQAATNSASAISPSTDEPDASDSR